MMAFFTSPISGAVHIFYLHNTNTYSITYNGQISTHYGILSVILSGINFVLATLYVPDECYFYNERKVCTLNYLGGSISAYVCKRERKREKRITKAPNQTQKQTDKQNIRTRRRKKNTEPNHTISICWMMSSWTSVFDSVCYKIYYFLQCTVGVSGAATCRTNKSKEKVTPARVWVCMSKELGQGRPTHKI